MNSFIRGTNVWLRACRVSLASSSLVFVLTGLCSDQASPTVLQILIATGAAACFHVFGYLTNDLVDLDLDRTNPARQDKPLPAGHISVRAARAVAIVALVAGGSVLLVGTSRPSVLTVYAAGAACGLVYNVYGKRAAFPPLMDFLQGAAWAFLVIVGCLVAGRSSIGLQGCLLAISTAFYIATINGFQGALRDHENDSRHGLKTTATYFLGPWSPDAIRLPGRYLAYGASMAAIHLILVLVASNSAGATRTSQTGAVVAIQSCCLLLLATAMTRYRQRSLAVSCGAAYVVLAPLGALAVALLTNGYAAFVLVTVLHLGSWATSRTVRSLAVELVVGRRRTGRTSGDGAEKRGVNGAAD